MKDANEAGGTHPDLAAAEEAAGAARALGALPAAYLEFRLEALRISRSRTADGSGPSIPALPSKESVERDLREGLPLLRAFRPRDGTYPETLARVAGLLKGAGIEGGDVLAGALSGAGGRRPDLDALAAAVTGRRGEDLAVTAAAIGVSPSLLRFAVSMALFPALSPAAEALKPLLRQDLWMRGWCPVCGAEPDYGTLVRKPEGARLLHCPACGTSWRAKRLGCPYCGNESGSEMEVLLEDAPSPRRLSACWRCRRYLKETDERKMPEGAPSNPTADEIVSLDLDLIAEAKGYRN
jgi:FdhE protein